MYYTLASLKITISVDYNFSIKIIKPIGLVLSKKGSFVNYDIDKLLSKYIPKCLIGVIDEATLSKNEEIKSYIQSARKKSSYVITRSWCTNQSRTFVIEFGVPSTSVIIIRLLDQEDGEKLQLYNTT